MPDIYISPDGKYETSLLSIQISDVKHNKKLGEYNGILKPLINNNTTLRLASSSTANINIDAIKNYSFIDYLRSVMQINLWVAIDFTGSNGALNLPNSLHYLGTKRLVEILLLIMILIKNFLFLVSGENFMEILL